MGKKGKSARQNAKENEQAKIHGPPPVNEKELIAKLIVSYGREGQTDAKRGRIADRLQTLGHTIGAD